MLLALLNPRFRFRTLDPFVILARGKHTLNSNLISILKSMPKDPKHIADAQKQRKKIKDKGARHVPSKVTLQVLGTGAEGAPKSLYMFSDQTRYLFNCGEGTQRLAHEHKMKLSRLEHIFITRSAWGNMGGLPGTALTIQDVGVPEIVLHGPKGVGELFKATRRFVIMKNLKIKTADCNESKKFEDSVMTVQYVPLERVPLYKKPEEESMESESQDETASSSDSDKDAQTVSGLVTMEASTSTRKSRKRTRSKSKNKRASVEEDEIDYYSPERKVVRVTSQSIISDDVKQELIETKERGMVMCYICRLQPRPGALNLDKCVKMGVPPGPLLGQLKNGEDVILKNGTTVKATDVCEPDDPGPVFLVVDCPSEEYLDSLIGSEALCKHQAQAGVDLDMPAVVIHFSPKEMFLNPRYQQWMDSFPASTRHLLLNDLNTCMGSASVHRIQYKLNILSEKIFPLLGESGTQIVEKADLENEKLIKPKVAYGDGVIMPRTGFSFHLRPRNGIDSTTEVKVVPSEYIEEANAVEGFKQELSVLRKEMSMKQKALKVRPYPEVLFLGTGSCIPNKTRNTSGILLLTSEKNNILVDCGEGTYGQIVRFFGEKNSQKVLANTDAIYISHLHADHHIGLIGFLQGRHLARKILKLPPKPVYLLAPAQILSWLNFYHLCFEDIEDYYDLIPNGELMKDNHKLEQWKKRELLETLNMTDISTCFVRHCPNAFGVAFNHNLGYKVTYSGDTMPCENLVSLGMNSDLLIHEATMEDDLADEAIVKMHSTTSQAISIGEKMEAKYVLLTHFSQRYAKLPRFNDNFRDHIGIAFDNMKIKLDELPLVPLLYSPLKVLFAEHYEELEQKAVKRQLRQEREQLAINADLKTIVKTDEKIEAKSVAK